MNEGIQPLSYRLNPLCYAAAQVARKTQQEPMDYKTEQG